MFRLVLTLILVLVSIALAAKDDIPAALQEMEEKAALRNAEVLGALLHQHDRAAAVATDLLLKVRGFKRNKNIDGWITEAKEDLIYVTFFGHDEEGSLVAFYRVAINSNGKALAKPSALRPPEALTEFGLAAARARSIAMASSFQACAEQYNTVTLPDSASLDRWVVYLLPATKKSKVIPAGGSYRVEVDIPTGAASIHPYTRTCIQLQNDPRAVALTITHLLHSVPTELHVLWSMWAEKPLYVATPPYGTIWSVDGANIRLIERREKE